MEKLYNKIKENILKINFQDIYKGFKPVRFALYNDADVYLDGEVFRTDSRFLGNTAIDFNGEWIAIWKVFKPDEEDTDIISANIVHEMFHAFQRKMGETRFPDDLVLLGYPDDIKNHFLRFLENTWLAKAYTLKEESLKREALYKFMETREYRIRHIEEMALHEFYTETLEGMAEFAGSLALKQLSEDKFNERMQDYIDILNSEDGIFFDIRRMCYYSGTMLCMVLKNLDICFYHKITDEKTALFYLVSKDIDIAGRQNREFFYKNNNICNAAVNYINKKAKEFTNMECMNYKTLTGEFTICGYDPMNMIRLGNKILFRHFVMLREEDKEEPEFINGPVIAYLKENSCRQVYLYMKEFKKVK